MHSITAKNTRWKYLGMAAMCVPFVFISGLMLIYPKSGSWRETLAAWSGVLFFGGCLLVFLREIFDSRPRIVVDDHGIFDRTLRVGIIEWQDIERAYLNSVAGNAYISLVLTDPEKYLQRAVGWQRKLARLNKHFGAEALNINLQGVDQSPNEIYAVVSERLVNRGIATDPNLHI